MLWLNTTLLNQIYGPLNQRICFPCAGACCNQNRSFHSGNSRTLGLVCITKIKQSPSPPSAKYHTKPSSSLMAYPSMSKMISCFAIASSPAYILSQFVCGKKRDFTIAPLLSHRSHGIIDSGSSFGTTDTNIISLKKRLTSILSHLYTVFSSEPYCEWEP